MNANVPDRAVVNVKLIQGHSEHSFPDDRTSPTEMVISLISVMRIWPLKTPVRDNSLYFFFQEHCVSSFSFARLGRQTFVGF